MRTYFHNPEKLNLNIMGVSVEGFSKGSFVTVRKDEEQSFRVSSSLKGNKLVNRHRHSGYTLTFRIDNTVSANTWLHSIHKLQMLYGGAFPMPVFYKDGNGSTNFFCLNGFLEEPTLDQGNEVGSSEWIVRCPTATQTIGGIGNDTTVAKALQVISNGLALADFAGVSLGGLVDNATGFISSVGQTLGGFF